jgi:hypothetical protein
MEPEFSFSNCSVDKEIHTFEKRLMIINPLFVAQLAKKFVHFIKHDLHSAAVSCSALTNNHDGRPP